MAEEASTNPTTGGDNHAAVATEDSNTEDEKCRSQGENRQERKEEGEEEEEEEQQQQRNARQEKQDKDDDVTLEAAAFYLYANNPKSLYVDASAATETPLDQDEMDDNDRELQQALSLSLRDAAILGVDQ